MNSNTRSFEFTICDFSNYTQKAMECELASLKLRASNVSNSDLCSSIFLKNFSMAILKSSLVR